MRNQPPGPEATMLMDRIQPALPFVTSRIRSAQDTLHDAFEERRPLVVLDRGWISGSKFLIQRFLANAGKGIAVVRVTDSCTSEIDAARELVRSIGFEPKNMGVTDLEAVFVNFLAFQLKRKRRTIVVFEETGGNSSWMHDYIRRLVDLESKSEFGLMVVLSRQTGLDDLKDAAPFNLLAHQNAMHVPLAPFTKAETRKFVRWRIDAADSAEIDGVLDIQAISLMHELCDGMPDAIEDLCCASIEIADMEDIAPVTADIVMRASSQIAPPPMHWQRNSTSGQPANIPTLEKPETAKVILIYKGITMCEKALAGRRISIGRAKDSDLCINSRFVSRQHAAIFQSGAETVVVDMDSTNGTFVNSRRIRVQTLADQDEIEIGYHIIRFVDPNANDRVSLDGISVARSASNRKPNSATSVFPDVARPQCEPDTITK